MTQSASLDTVWLRGVVVGHYWRPPVNVLPDLPERLGTVDDVATFLNSSKSYVYKEVEAGRLPCIRVGTMIRFDMAAIRRFFAAATTPAKAPAP